MGASGLCKTPVIAPELFALYEKNNGRVMCGITEAALRCACAVLTAHLKPRPAPMHSIGAIVGT